MTERSNGKFKYKGNTGEIFHKFHYNRNASQLNYRLLIEFSIVCWNNQFGVHLSQSVFTSRSCGYLSVKCYFTFLNKLEIKKYFFLEKI